MGGRVDQLQAQPKQLSSSSPIRVLIIDHGMSFGGTVVVASSLLRHANRDRVKLTFATAASRKFAESRLNKIDDVHFLRPAYTYVHAASVKRLLAAVDVPMLRRIANIAISLAGALINLPYILRLLTLALKRRAHIIHCNNGANLEGLVVARLLNIPCLFHVHGLGGERSRLNTFLRRFVRGHFLAISSVVRDEIVSNGVHPSNVSLLLNPVEVPDLNEHAASSLRRRERSALGLTEDDILVGMVGRVVPWKGQREFIEACIIALRASQRIHAVIIGDAADGDKDYFTQLRRSVVDAGLSDRIHFRGFVEDPNSIYAGLDILVHSSIAPEPFGLVITEAMARGIPPIVSNIGAPPELVKDSVTGFISDPMRPQDVAGRIVDLANNSRLRVIMGNRARLDTLQRHDARDFAQRMEEIYAFLTSKSASESQ